MAIGISNIATDVAKYRALNSSVTGIWVKSRSRAWRSVWRNCRASAISALAHRLHVVPIGWRFHSCRINRHDTRVVSTGAGFPEQALDELLGLLVLALAKLMVANAAPRIDQVQSGPILVAEGAPD
jgi:hypothetical protein